PLWSWTLTGISVRRSAIAMRQMIRGRDLAAPPPRRVRRELGRSSRGRGLVHLIPDTDVPRLPGCESHEERHHCYSDGEDEPGIAIASAGDHRGGDQRQ